MYKANTKPGYHQISSVFYNLLKEFVVLFRVVVVNFIEIIFDGEIGQSLQSIGFLLCRKQFEMPEPQETFGGSDDDRTFFSLWIPVVHHVTYYFFPCETQAKRPCSGHSEVMHGFADQVFANGRPKH